MLCATSSSPGGRSGRGVGMRSQHVATDANRRERKGKKMPFNSKPFLLFSIFTRIFE